MLVYGNVISSSGAVIHFGGHSGQEGLYWYSHMSVSLYCICYVCEYLYVYKFLVPNIVQT